MRSRRAVLGALVVAGVLGPILVSAFGCSPESRHEGRRPLLVFGIDGGEWRVIRDLWSQGRLPHLRALADRGVTAELATDYGASPVIWTTIATGRRPQEHGITGFVTWTDDDTAIPVSSGLRRVPALWNMTSRMGLRTAVLGWWATWPAEPIRGIVVSDRSNLDLEHRVSPDEFLPTFLEDLAAARVPPNPFRGNQAAAERDRSVTLTAQRLAADFDVQLIYFRSVDIASHDTWKYYQPDRYEEGTIDPAELEQFKDEIPDAYAAVDAALGDILAAADSDANVVVVSDHGFHALVPEKVRAHVDYDKVLKRMGYQNARGPLDCKRSKLYTHRSGLSDEDKLIRFCLAKRDEGARIGRAQAAKVREKLTAELAKVTFAQGQPAFEVRDPRPRESRKGADFVVTVRSQHATPTVRIGDRTFDDLVVHLDRVSGSHGEHTSGIFIAAGPDIDPEADLEGIDIHDIAPTLLYALGLPVGEDFAGKARTDLFKETFRNSRPLRTIPTWGEMESWHVEASAVDEELVEELRTLGYL